MQQKHYKQRDFFKAQVRNQEYTQNTPVSQGNVLFFSGFHCLLPPLPSIRITLIQPVPQAFNTSQKNEYA